MSAPPDSVPVSVAGTPAATARKLIALQWNVNDQGLWSNGIVAPCSAEIALAVAETLAKAAPFSGPAASPAAASTPVENWWTHLAGSMRGTVGLSLLTSIVTSIVANPPPEMLFSPTVSAGLKWILPILATALLGSQLPASVKAVKG